MRCRNAKHPILLLRAAHTRSVKPGLLDAGVTATAKQRQLQSLYQNTVPNAMTQSNPLAATANASEDEDEDEGEVVVGNNIEFDENSTALVISGPNAGGKTVVLKVSPVNWFNFVLFSVLSIVNHYIVSSDFSTFFWMNRQLDYLH